MDSPKLSFAYILDENGEPRQEPDSLKWALWFEDPERRRIRVNTFGSVTVSTVFLGIDMSAGLGKNPSLFETMVFGGPWNHEIRRYPTREQAVAGHEEMLKLIQTKKSASDTGW